MKRMLMLLGVVAMVCVSCGGRGAGTVVVTNHAGDVADQIVVTADGKDHVISKLKNGESETWDFKVGEDGVVSVNVLMMDGTTATKAIAYVTGDGAGVEKRLEIEIDENKEILAVQK
jgi:hypothetical protein